MKRHKPSTILAAMRQRGNEAAASRFASALCAVGAAVKAERQRNEADPRPCRVAARLAYSGGLTRDAYLSALGAELKGGRA